MLNKQRLSPWLAISAFVLGAAWAYANLGELRRAIEPRYWPTVPGIVTESRISHDTEPAAPRFSRVHRRIVTRFHIRYGYMIDGREYSSTRLNLRPPTARPDARSLVTHYPNGATVTVYYNATDPRTAVIDASIPIASVAQAILGGAVAALGLWFSVRRFGR
jgi:hypothetical protein